MATTKGTNGLSLNVQHDYITLKTPNGNFTINWGGAKATGKLASHSTAFKNLDKYVQDFLNKGGNKGDAMNSLLNPEVLTSLWANWNDPVQENEFGIGDRVKFVPSIFIKKYPNGGVVVSVKKKTVYIRLADVNEGVVGFDCFNLVKQ